MKISINITPESPEDLARVFAFLSGRDGVELAPLDAAAVAKASAEENATAAAEAKPAPKKPRKKAAKKAAPKKAAPEQTMATPEAKADVAAEAAKDSRKQIELDLRAFAAEHGMPELRDALKSAQLPRLQDAAEADLPKFRAILDQLASAKGTELS